MPDFSKLTVTKDESGQIVPIDNNKTPLSPTNVPGITPQQAAADGVPEPTPQVAPTAPTVEPTSGDATIWNPNTGKKKVVKIGDPIPTGWSLWTGGTATGEEAQQAILDKAPPVEEEKPLGELAGDALDEEPPTEEPPVEEKPAEARWETPSTDKILEEMGVEKAPTQDFTQNYQDLIDWQENQLETIDLKYSDRIAEQEQADEQSLAALKARLIKAGALTGSISSASAGEIARAAERIRKIEKDREMEKANVRSSYLKGKMDLGKQERDDVWNAYVMDTNNMFKAKGITMDIWQAFNQRDQFERQQEQQSKEFLTNLKFEWYKFDEAKKADAIKKIQDFAEKGLYDMYDEDTVALLHEYEDKYGMEVGSIVDPATGGYWKRITDKAYTTALTKESEARAEKALRVDEKKGTGNNLQKALSTTEIEKYKKLYGITLPLGTTRGEAEEMLKPVSLDEFAKVYMEENQVSVSPNLLQDEYTDYISAFQQEFSDEKLTVGEFFSNTQIARGAKEAEITIEEFKQLPVDEANKYIANIKSIGINFDDI